MVAINTREIDSYVAKPSPAHAIILVFGADVGLVRERADALIKSAVDDINDPFSLVRLEGDDLAAEPSRLVDEAMTVPLFGGRRAIRVRAGGKNFSSGVNVLLQEPPKDCRIVIEAGELRKDSPLRAMCEKAKTAAVIACYADGVRDLSRLIDDELNAANLRIAQDARAALVELLGGDRLASRNEIRKLTLYAHGRNEITLDDIAAVVTDASNLALDPIIDNTFAGQPAEVEVAFAKAVAAGINPNAIMFAAQRQASQLHNGRGTAGGRSLRAGHSALAFRTQAAGRSRAQHAQHGEALAAHRAARRGDARTAQACRIVGDDRAARTDGDRRQRAAEILAFRVRRSHH
jgi:DNA polymerase III subunit delta